MAWTLLPAGLPAALPSTRRSAALSKGHHNRVACMDQLHWKLPLTAAESNRSGSLVVCCTCPGSSAEAATSSRPADVSSGHNYAPIVISGYWIGPDIDDVCGHIQAILQRIS